MDIQLSAYLRDSAPYSRSLIRGILYSYKTIDDQELTEIFLTSGLLEMECSRTALPNVGSK